MSARLPSRRRLLCDLAVGLAAFSSFPRVSLGKNAYGPFKMGIQSYSLRHFDLEGALDRTRELGLPYVQVFAGKKHILATQDKAKIAVYKTMLKSRGLTMLSWGVEDFTKDHERNRSYFEFARAIGVRVLVAYPAPDAFDSLEKLTRDYGVKIAIHNHGPEDRLYGELAQMMAALDKRPEAIGVCIDTGHALRVGENPIDWIDAFGRRVYDCHLKDASGPQTYNVLGKGKLDLVGTLRALQKAKFDGILALEHEEKPEAPMAELQECLAAVREAVTKL